MIYFWEGGTDTLGIIFGGECLVEWQEILVASLEVKSDIPCGRLEDVAEYLLAGFVRGNLEGGFLAASRENGGHSYHLQM